MMKRKSDRMAIREALEAAVLWEESLADAQADPACQAYLDAMSAAEHYREILKKRYGVTQTRHEQMFANSTVAVSVFDTSISERREFKFTPAT